jgi:hypothetical protein
MSADDETSAAFAGEYEIVPDTMIAQCRRCPVCGWPMAASVKEGCVPGNCAQRPAPRKQQPFEYSPETSDAAARLSAEVASLKVALAHWRQKADEDAGRLKRYEEALYWIGHKPVDPLSQSFGEIVRELQERARIELSATAMVGHPEGPAA